MKRNVLALLLLLLVSPRWATPQQAQDAAPQPPSDEVQNELAEARELLAAGSIDSAVSLLRQLIAKHPENPDAHLLLGSSLALAPRQSEAIAELRRAIELRPSFPQAHNTLGMALARFGEPQAAQEAFQRALELDPELAEAHANLGLVLAQQARFAEAREHLSRAVDLRKGLPATAYWHYLIGKTLSEEGQVAEAAAQFKEATLLRPDYGPAYLALGLARKLLLDREAALEALQRAAALSPQDAEAAYELGIQLQSLGKIEQAVVHLRHADELRPDSRPILFALHRALRRAGLTEEADQVQERLNVALRRDDRGRETVLQATELNNQAVQLEREGRLPAALDKYRQALEMYPFHAGFRRNLGLLLCRLQLWDEGIAELEEAASLDPEDKETTRALYIALDQAAAAKEAAAAGKDPH